MAIAPLLQLRPPIRFLSLALLLGLSLGLANCTSLRPDQASSNQASADSPLSDNRPKVIATSTIIADLSQTIGGEEITLIGLLPPGDDPHIYEPVPADIKALETADLILYNGFNLEPALIRLIEASSQATPRLAVGEVVEPLAFDEAGQKQPDPHVWGDVSHAIAMVNAIRDALIELSPEDEARFIANAQPLVAQLSDLDNWISRQIATIPPDQRRLVTTHDAFAYYAQAYGLEIIGTLIGISTEEQPSAQTVQRLVEAIRAAGVPAIFAETTINPQLITTVAREAGVSLAPQALYSDSIGAAGSPGDSYLKMMESNTQSIVNALGGSYQPFEIADE